MQYYENEDDKSGIINILFNCISRTGDSSYEKRIGYTKPGNVFKSEPCTNINSTITNSVLDK